MCMRRQNKTLKLLLVIVVSCLLSLSSQGQESSNQQDDENQTGRIDSANDLTIDVFDGKGGSSLGQTLEESEYNANNSQAKPPQYTPPIWIDDYDYKTPINEYLNDKFRMATASKKQIYVYLYADWLDACRSFRKTASQKDYVELMSTSAIVMLEYSFFKKNFNTRARKLPMLLKVNENGVLGPEILYPVSKSNDHPRKVFHKLKVFLHPTD